MLKSITTSKEAEIYKNHENDRMFATVLNDIPRLNEEINQAVQKYKEWQIRSQQAAMHIRSR
ncbi:MAG: hypothetical protein ACSW8F_06740 [bacterium]